MQLIEAVRERAQAFRNMYRRDQSPWEERTGQLDSECLLEELKRNRKLANINDRIQQIEALGMVTIGYLFVSTGVREGVVGSVLAAGAMLLIHSGPRMTLGRRIDFINSEVNSRRDQAIFYQDPAALAALEGVSS